MRRKDAVQRIDACKNLFIIRMNSCRLFLGNSKISCVSPNIRLGLAQVRALLQHKAQSQRFQALWPRVYVERLQLGKF